MKIYKLCLLIATLFVPLACSTQRVLTDTEVASRYPEINQLADNLKRADNEDVDLLSNTLYRQAMEQYKASLASAQKANNDARGLANKGQATLDKAVMGANATRDVLADAIVARNRAVVAGAHEKNTKEFVAADEKLIELGDLTTEGAIADVREQRQALAKRYAKLEVATLQYTTAKDAKEQLRNAERLRADRYAPETYKQAVEQLALANNVLASDADSQTKAAGHAHNAYNLASRAVQITKIIKEFQQSGMTDEQIVLWYQTQLTKAVAPTTLSPDFVRPNDDMIADLALNIQSMVNNASESAQSLQASRRDYAEELTMNEAQKQRQAEIDDRFRTVQNAFTNEEAEVYRQGNDVLIRAYGFNFPSGSSEIQSDNFPLLNKITASIGQFPESKVQVSGHTDSRGGDSLNMDLSRDRARKVAKFLVDVGNMSTAKVSSIGFASKQPLASNETAAGRAENRRVEILIINE